MVRPGRGDMQPRCRTPMLQFSLRCGALFSGPDRGPEIQRQNQLEGNMNLTIALRLLAAAGIMSIAIPAAAQSNVSISGSLDIGAFRDKADVKNVGNIQRSHIQFAGS